MISEEEARKKIIESVRPLASRRLSLSQTLGCFAADEYLARLPLPTFDNSAMDGYAVVASSCAKGERLRAATIALLASQGIGDLTVGGEVNAAIISTGDELVKAGEKLEPGEIYESNSALLNALLQRCGVAVNLVEHCRDERESL